MERREHTPVDERRRQVREDLRTVLRQHSESGPARHAPRPLGLDQLAGPSSDLGVRRDAPGEMDAWRVVVGGEALDNEVREQRLVVERRGHPWQSSSQTVRATPERFPSFIENRNSDIDVTMFGSARATSKDC